MNRGVDREQVALQRTRRPHFKLLDPLGIRGPTENLLAIFWRAEVEQESHGDDEAVPQVTQHCPKQRPDSAVRLLYVIIGRSAYRTRTGDKGGVWGRYKVSCQRELVKSCAREEV